jgi:CheY-like chemotaxis protein
MPDSAAEIKRSVLIVDGSAESREVLRTVLARRGVEVIEAAGARALPAAPSRSSGVRS